MGDIVPKWEGRNMQDSINVIINVKPIWQVKVNQFFLDLIVILSFICPKQVFIVFFSSTRLTLVGKF